jgi:hypothetical protein
MDMITVITPQNYIRQAAAIMNDDERAALVDYIARNPEAGDVIRGTGGLRKVRWAIGNSGKSGGARIIYYYHNDEIPLFLLAAYKKGAKGSLDDNEKSAFKKAIHALVSQYER